MNDDEDSLVARKPEPGTRTGASGSSAQGTTGRAALMGWGVFATCWGVAAAVAVALGRDVNLDLQNYHFYNAYALLEGRWTLDLAAAGMHSFLHPGLDLPYYLMTRGPLNAWPWLVTALQAGYFGILAFLVLAVANLCCHGDVRRLTWASLLVALLGLTGVGTLPEAGATQNDVQIGCLVLGALLSLLLGGTRLGLLAGFLGGAAIALKLTAAIYALPLAAAALITVQGGPAERLRSVALLALGGALGFVLVHGPWGWFLWQHFGNPFGPFFNNFFHSPWFQIENPRDTAFLPQGLAQALTYPFLWAHRSEWIVIEPQMADPRFAIGLSALLVASVAGAWERLRLGPPADPALRDSSDRAASRATWAVMVFVATAYIAWLLTFSILRYAVAIEMLLGIPVWAAARSLLDMQRSRDPMSSGAWRRGAALCVGAVLGVCALVTEYPDHARAGLGPIRGLRGTVSAAPVALPDGSLVVVAGMYVSFLAPFIAGRDIRFVGATQWTAGGAWGWTPEWRAAPALGSHRLATESERLIRSYPGPVFVLLDNPDPAEKGQQLDLSVVQAFGITFDRGSCQPMVNTISPFGQICRSR
ncbi:hypothetical protein ACFQX4_26310 [Roseomonas sp. GCM10028921]